LRKLFNAKSAGGSSGLAAARILSLALALVGALLACFPRMDQPWLDALEHVLPAVQEAFLEPEERETRAESMESIERDSKELRRLRALEQDVRWGATAMDAEKQERLRQFLAGRGELTAGDRMVLRTLRAKARERQRYWIGVPLLAVGAGGVAWLARRRR
jgi:zinc/manganese transport system permease protein